MVNKTQEALKLAREMLIENREYIQLYERPSYLALYDKTIARVEEALAEQPAQQKPLTDDEIDSMYLAMLNDKREFDSPKDSLIAIVRAVEVAHGITG